MNATQSALRDNLARALARRALDAMGRAHRPLAAMLDQGLVSGASFAAAVFIGRVAGEQQLGLYALAATLLVLAAGVQESLVLIPYTVFAAGSPDDLRRRYAASAFVQSALAGLGMIGCLAVACAVLAARPAVPELSTVLMWLLVVTPAALLREFGRRVAFAHLWLGRALAIDGAVTIIQLALLTWLAVTGKLSATSGVAVLGISCGAVALAWLWQFRGEFRFVTGELRGDWRRSWSLGKWLVAGHVTGISQAYALHWILAIIVGTAGTGEFAAVMTIVSLANPFIIGLGNFLMPTTAHAFAKSGAAGVWKVAFRATAWLGTALAIFCLLLASTGSWVLTFLYGERFAGQSTTIGLLALAVSAAALGLGPEHALRSMDRPRAVFVANLLALLTTLAMAVWLVPTRGTIGAAYSMSAGNTVGCLVRWWAFATISDFGFRIFRPRAARREGELCDRDEEAGA
ncbi:MAG TPA: polysaccharide biosynthesis C-terminal domain-containing protein [Pirellulales bacterium]|nr:polysaccharide biosynthesis C-terminal domain-containing protein [Pirellulales bacterium]